jgi:nucleoside-diphosphate-sugar epimerase
MNPLSVDLDQVMDRTEDLWAELRGGRVLLTGGTGFFGCWLLESFLWANKKFGLNAEIVVLTRNCAAFESKAPHLAHDPAVRLHQGDMQEFSLPAGKLTHAIHAAGEPSLKNPADPAGLLERSFDGMRHVLQQARRHGVSKMLFTSSGAVYGPPKPGRQRVSEDDECMPIPIGPRGAYAESKRTAEMFGAVFARQNGFEFKIARGFAFFGPYLPLDSHLAAGNFISDALAGGSIIVRSSGTAVRSYLYGADLAVWLWTILCRGESGRPYNLGSDIPISIAELAQAVAHGCHPVPAVHVLGQAQPVTAVDYYVPDISRARTELGLTVSIPLNQAIQRTLAWHGRREN